MTGDVHVGCISRAEKAKTRQQDVATFMTTNSVPKKIGAGALTADELDVRMACAHFFLREGIPISKMDRFV